MTCAPTEVPSARDEALEYLARSRRYSGAVDIEVGWMVAAVNDGDAVQVDPYWTSRVNALAIIQAT